MDAISAPVSSQAFRDAMARLAMTVHLVTTDGQAGRGGATVTALCSVTDSPPTLLICLSRDSRTNELIQKNRVLAVNTLRSGQEALSGIFASGNQRSMEERFSEALWTSLTTGAPVLAGSLATFDCRVSRIEEVGTHSVVFAEIVALAMPPAGEVLIHVNRGYRSDLP